MDANLAVASRLKTDLSGATCGSIERSHCAQKQVLLGLVRQKLNLDGQLHVGYYRIKSVHCQEEAAAPPSVKTGGPTENL